MIDKMAGDAIGSNPPYELIAGSEGRTMVRKVFQISLVSTRQRWHQHGCQSDMVAPAKAH